MLAKIHKEFLQEVITTKLSKSKNYPTEDFPQWEPWILDNPGILSTGKIAIPTNLRDFVGIDANKRQGPVANVR